MTLYLVLGTVSSLLALAVVAHVAGERANGADWGIPWVNRLDGLIRLFCRRWHRLRADAIPLPAHGPALLVSNHMSGLDALLLAASVRRPLRFIIAREEYERIYLRWFFRAIGCIPVDRTGRPERAFRDALRALHQGDVVALFPHGTIHLDSDPPRKLKPGVARLAHLAECPVYPVRIDGVSGQGSILASLLLRGRARVSRCPPVPCHELSNADCLEAVAACIEQPRQRV